jgi:hypothetical protein
VWGICLVARAWNNRAWKVQNVISKFFQVVPWLQKEIIRRIYLVESAWNVHAWKFGNIIEKEKKNSSRALVTKRKLFN